MYKQNKNKCRIYRAKTLSCTSLSGPIFQLTGNALDVPGILYLLLYGGGAGIGRSLLQYTGYVYQVRWYRLYRAGRMSKSCPADVPGGRTINSCKTGTREDSKQRAMTVSLFSAESNVRAIPLCRKSTPKALQKHSTTTTTPTITATDTATQPERRLLGAHADTPKRLDTQRNNEIMSARGWI